MFLFRAPMMFGLVPILLNVICVTCNNCQCCNYLKDCVCFCRVECHYSYTDKFKCIGNVQRKIDIFLSISQSEISHNCELIFNSKHFILDGPISMTYFLKMYFRAMLILFLQENVLYSCPYKANWRMFHICVNSFLRPASLARCTVLENG